MTSIQLDITESIASSSWLDFSLYSIFLYFVSNWITKNLFLAPPVLVKNWHCQVHHFSTQTYQQNILNNDNKHIVVLKFLINGF